MSDFEELARRVNDTVVQTRCDRRTLATLAVFFRTKEVYVGSISNLLRIGIEQMRRFAVEFEGAEDILSTDDATHILKSLGRASLNPGGRGMFTHVQQMQKESIYLDEGDINYASERRTKGKLIKEKDLSDRVREAEKLVPGVMKEVQRLEDIKQAQKRREDETQDMKTGLSQVPSNAVKKEEE